MHRGEFAQMIGPYFGVYLALPERHMQAVGAHGLDVRGPLVNEHDIEPGICEVGRDATAVRAGTENCDFLFHDVYRDAKLASHGADQKSLRPTRARAVDLNVTLLLRLQVVLLDELGHFFDVLMQESG